MAEQWARALDQWLAQHRGVVTRAALRSMGASDRSIHRLVAAGRLVRMCRGLYRSRAHPPSPAQLSVGACLLNRDAAIAFTTAGRELGLRGMVDDAVHVLIPHDSTLTLPGVVVHRCRRIDRVDVTGRRADGVRLTSPPRTLFDAASLLSDDVTASAVEQVLAERMCTMGTLMSTLARLSRPNRPGAARFERVLLSRPVLRGAARSELERVVRAAIEAAGLPEPDVNMPLTLPNGDHVVIDLAWPRWRLAVEVDHPFWHDREAEAARDKRRDRKLAAAGWLPQRITKSDVDHALGDAVADVRNVLAVRGWSPETAA